MFKLEGLCLCNQPTAMPLVHRPLAITLLFALCGGFVCAQTIVIEGSDTLGAKLVPQLTEAFKARMQGSGQAVAFEVAAEGSNTGIASLISGTAAIGMSSRDPDSKEIASARTQGVELVPIRVATDGIAIIVNEANPLDSISMEEIETIFTGDIQDWAGLTNRQGQISVYTRNTASGTYKEFQKIAMSDRNYGNNALKLAGNEQIAEEVASNPYGIGYVGLAYISRPGIKVLRVDNLMPNDKDYQIARPLYFLINKNQPLDPLVNDFIGFTLSPAGQAVVTRVHCLPNY